MIGCAVGSQYTNRMRDFGDVARNTMLVTRMRRVCLNGCGKNRTGPKMEDGQIREQRENKARNRERSGTRSEACRGEKMERGGKTIDVESGNIGDRQEWNRGK